MSNLLVSFLLEAMLAVLLIATISYCSKLSRRIRLLQDSRGELSEMINRFDQATARASTSLAELQSVSKKITDGLQLKIEKANFLADDLAFLIEKSAKIATQLEQAKKAQPGIPAEKPKPITPPRPMFEAVPIKKPSVIPSPDEKAVASKVTASLEAILQRLSSNPAGDTSSSLGARTPAERELAQALKGGR